MTGHQPNRPSRNDAGLDELIDSAMSGILAKLDAAFRPRRRPSRHPCPVAAPAP